MSSPRFLFACLLLVLMAPAASAQTLYVAPGGSDHRPGGPFASLEGARDAVRRLRTAGSLHKPVRVVIANGVYSLTRPFVLTPEDSGTPSAPILYEAEPNAHPLFSGGRLISGFRRGPDGVWTASIPDVKAGKWYFEQLWVNGVRATRARSPNQGYFNAAGDSATLPSRAFRARPEDIAPLLALPADQLKDVTLIAYHSWEISRNRIAAIDAKSGTLVMTKAVPWPFFNWGPPRFLLENYPAALDMPGEWFLSRDGTLSYKPLPGEDMTKAVVIAPMIDQFVQIVGNPEQQQWVQNITFRGLAFEYGQYILPPEGHADGQAEVSIPAAITADGARNVSFERCEIAHVGVYGLWLREGCQNDSVVHCYLHDLGAGGMRIGEEQIRPAEEGRTGHNAVDNNIIHSAGRIHQGAIGIWIGQSGDNAVTHNDIGDMPYTGISVGWRWGYAESLAKRNHIDFNHVHQIGEGVLNDLGGIYTLGPSEGTTVSGNVVSDIVPHNESGWGLYADEGSSGILWANNLVHDTLSGGLHQHYGKENIIRNNIFAFGQNAQAQRTRVEDHLSFTFENNIVYWNGGPAFWGDWSKNVALQKNLYWNTENDPAAFGGLSFSHWQATGQDAGSVVADPQFMNPAANDFRFRPGSAASQIGFIPFDTRNAGVYGDPAWVRLAQTPKMPALPGVTPLTLSEGFENIPVGMAPPEPVVNVEHRGDTIEVTDEAARSGKRSLKIVDAPGLIHEYDPHFYYTPHHQEGVTRCAFDIRAEAGVNMYHEWRDSASPYRVGPSLSIVGGKLLVGNRALLNIPTGQWVHLEIAAGLGKSSTGTWDLTVTLPGQPPHRFPGLKNGSVDWRRLEWLGFVSSATEKTVFYLDNITLSNNMP